MAAVRRPALLAAILAFFIILVPAAHAADKSVLHNVSVTATLAPDGSAAIEETWDMTIKKGTENYKQLFDMKNESLDGFSVSENDVPYQRVDPWNVDLSRAQKEGRYGVNQTQYGPELCWGIGMENGRRVYKIRYGVRDMVTLHDDEDGSVKAALYWQFISKKFQRAGHVDLRVVPPGPIGPDHHFWIFGFNGTIGVRSNDYHIQAKKVKAGHFVELGLIMPAGDFPKAKKVAYPKLDVIRNNGRSGDDLGNFKAKAPSIFSELSGELYFLGIWFLLFGAIALVGFIAWLRSRVPIKKHAPRSVQPEETLEAIAHLLSVFYKTPELLNTFMITWIYKKHIRIEQGSAARASDTKIYLDSEPERFDGRFEKRFFNVVEGGLRDEEGTSIKIYRRYLKRCRTNERLLDIDDDFTAGSAQYCRNRGWITERKRLIPRSVSALGALACVALFGAGMFSFWALIAASIFFVCFILLHFALRRRDKLTPEGQEVIGSVLGFANYLCNYSLLEKRGVEHIELWDSYMAFAHLLGIAGKLEKELSKLSPSYRMDSPCTVYIHSGVYRDSTRSAYRPSSSSDSGGGSGSSGGGGGGSGGGGGGGTR